MGSLDRVEQDKIEIERYYQNLSLQLRLHGAVELGRKYVVVRLARMLANAFVDFSELERVLSRVSDSASWFPAFKAAAEEWERLAEQAVEGGHTVSAADHFLRASAMWHWGAYLAKLGSSDKALGRSRRVELYQRATQYLDPPVRRIEIPYKGNFLPGYLHQPRGVEKPPVIIMIDGADSVKEEYHNWAQQFVRRNFAVVTFDGPGQGEAQSRGIWMVPHEYETAVTAVADFLEDLGEVDTDRIGAWGSSMGGYLVSRAAAFEPRIKAAISLGGFYDFRDFPNWYISTQLNVMEDLNLKSLEETRSYVARHCSLEDVNHRIQVPYMVIHGARDELVTVEEARQMAGDAPRGEFVLFEDGFHTCTNYNLVLTALMADWFEKHLL